VSSWSIRACEVTIKTSRLPSGQFGAVVCTESGPVDIRARSKGELNKSVRAYLILSGMVTHKRRKQK
jgi:hypothetical protein